MGVFARLFRRSKTTEETRTAGAQADGATAGAGTEGAAGTAEPKGPAEAQKSAEPAVKKAGEVTATEAVDIPKQQSSEAAGSEAGEGART
ncbi:hypothetical protein ACFVZC_24010 [Streptomyces marokkonensis]|uniref:Gliding motility protein n=1 Tax=Streptomyces marokkonensis TaxID=324855 RepID=A0ABW6QB36_9ACTN